MIQVGEYDPSFPAADARREYARLRRIYRAAGAADRLALGAFDGCHEICVAPILEWLGHWLKRDGNGPHSG